MSAPTSSWPLGLLARLLYALVAFSFFSTVLGLPVSLDKRADTSATITDLGLSDDDLAAFAEARQNQLQFIKNAPPRTAGPMDLVGMPADIIPAGTKPNTNPSTDLIDTGSIADLAAAMAGLDLFDEGSTITDSISDKAVSTSTTAQDYTEASARFIAKVRTSKFTEEDMPTDPKTYQTTPEQERKIFAAFHLLRKGMVRFTTTVKTGWEKSFESASKLMSRIGSRITAAVNTDTNNKFVSNAMPELDQIDLNNANQVLEGMKQINVKGQAGPAPGPAPAPAPAPQPETAPVSPIEPESPTAPGAPPAPEEPVSPLEPEPPTGPEAPSAPEAPEAPSDPSTPEDPNKPNKPKPPPTAGKPPKH